MHVVFVILFGILGVRGLVSDDDRCSGPDASARMWSLIRAFQENRSNWHFLEEDGCLGKEELDTIASDPEDAAEYLGDEGAPSLFSPSLCMRLKRPNVFSIGVGHCGSTTLSRHLERHPLISFGMAKEHYYWKAGRKSRQTFRQYLMEFPVPCRTRAVIDFPVRLYRQALKVSQDACEWGPWDQRGQTPTPLGEPFVYKFRETMGPDIRFIVMIRDQYERLHSVRVNGTEVLSRLDAGEGLDPRTTCMWEGSRYAEALEVWLRYYPRQNFLFVKSEDFFARPQEVLNQIFQFLGVTPRPYSENELAYHSGRRRAANKRLITDKMRHHFHQHPLVKRDREKLQQLTGLDFHWDPLQEA